MSGDATDFWEAVERIRADDDRFDPAFYGFSRR